MIRLLVIVLCFFSSLGFSQTGFLTTPQVISTVGGNWIQNNYNLSFTVGEIAIVTHIEQSTILTQGFHQENYQLRVASSSLNKASEYGNFRFRI